MKNKRRDFLKKVCPSVALAFFGVTMLEACSSGDEEDSSSNGGDSSSKGYTVNGNTVVIDLNHSSFSSLNSSGWMNFTTQNMLLLKIDSSTYRAFTNSCPHQGTRNAWSYNTSEDKFKCSSHGNSYPSDCTTAGTAGGALKCFTASFASNKLTITTS
jgi:nitrite reductase/ring-hydroxylating ferredoxin subunit